MKLTGNFLTVKEMAEKLGKKPNAVKQLLYQLEIWPVVKEALYEESALERLNQISGPGRPKKPPAETETCKSKPTKQPKRR